MLRFTHFTRLMDFQIYVDLLQRGQVIGKERKVGYRIRCSCGKELPEQKDRFFLTIEEATVARRSHELLNRKAS